MQNKNIFCKKQRELANILGVTQQAVSSWVSGRCQPPIKKIPKLAKVLNCSVEEVVFALIEAQEQSLHKKGA